MALHTGPPVAESATGCASDACGTRVGLAVAFGSVIMHADSPTRALWLVSDLTRAQTIFDLK